MYICIFDCSVYSDRYVEVEHDICCDREKKQRDYTLMKVKSVFFSLSQQFFNFKLGAFQSKNTWVMIVLVETVHMQRYQASKNQFSASIYLKTILTYSDAKLR